MADEQPPVIQEPNRKQQRPVFLEFLAFMLLTYTFVFLGYASFFWDKAKGDEQVVTTVVGALITMVLSGIIGYFYGSSAGSREKDAHIQDQAGRKL